MNRNATTDQRLAEALDIIETGKYRKGIHYLHKGNCFCFSGALCDISGVGEWRDMFGDGVHSYKVEEEDGKLVQTSCKFMPQSVREYYGLTSRFVSELAVENDYSPELPFDRCVHLARVYIEKGESNE